MIACRVQMSWSQYRGGGALAQFLRRDDHNRRVTKVLLPDAPSSSLGPARVAVQRQSCVNLSLTVTSQFRLRSAASSTLSADFRRRKSENPNFLMIARLFLGRVC